VCIPALAGMTCTDTTIISYWNGIECFAAGEWTCERGMGRETVRRGD
jgi:hypothetical protein